MCVTIDPYQELAKVCWSVVNCAKAQSLKWPLCPSHSCLMCPGPRVASCQTGSIGGLGYGWHHLGICTCQAHINVDATPRRVEHISQSPSRDGSMNGNLFRWGFANVKTRCPLDENGIDDLLDDATWFRQKVLNVFVVPCGAWMMVVVKLLSKVSTGIT